MKTGLTFKIESFRIKYRLYGLGLSIWLILALALVFGCGTGTRVVDNPETLAEFTRFVEQKSFEFTANTAHPMPTQAFYSVANSGILPPGSTSGAIQLIGISNFIKIQGDSISGILPFYGERQFGGGPTSKTGIEFEGVPSAYKQTYNAKKKRYEIVFDISNETEQHQINMILFPNKSANVSVNSNQRNSIRFIGAVTAIESESD